VSNFGTILQHKCVVNLPWILFRIILRKKGDKWSRGEKSHRDSVVKTTSLGCLCTLLLCFLLFLLGNWGGVV